MPIEQVAHLDYFDQSPLPRRVHTPPGLWFGNDEPRKIAYLTGYNQPPLDFLENARFSSRGGLIGINWDKLAGTMIFAISQYGVRAGAKRRGRTLCPPLGVGRIAPFR